MNIHSSNGRDGTGGSSPLLPPLSPITEARVQLAYIGCLGKRLMVADKAALEVGVPRSTKARRAWEAAAWLLSLPGSEQRGHQR
uniref:Uncharacterized protein n=1 Tax=Oryza punctata TaxID=4537 RepID=A0A0E0KQR0_ORYPU